MLCCSGERYRAIMALLYFIITIISNCMNFICSKSLSYLHMICAIFLCPRLPKAGVGHISFRCDVTFISVYMHMYVCHVGKQSLTNVTVYIQVYMQVYVHIYIHIYVQVAHNFDTFYATKLKFDMIFTQTKTLDFMVELPLGEARGQNV